MVPRVGLEPTRPFGHCVLSAGRLPISPPGHYLFLNEEPGCKTNCNCCSKYDEYAYDFSHFCLLMSFVSYYTSKQSCGGQSGNRTPTYGFGDHHSSR
ncbi:hypothetical protein RsoM2USA_171 [Ralstonia phage RsoM2USA]|nr:hypothetical protein RsoM2USA_171 [Ralstonia phage RsoM2USA]